MRIARRLDHEDIYTDRNHFPSGGWPGPPTRNLMLAILTLVLGLLPAWSVRGERFPFVISGYDALPSATDFSGLSPGPAGADGFVRIADGHFATDSGRLRIWGVNLCFGANFPTHEQADKVAAHLAKMGINGVRIHHHETQFAPRGLLRRDGTFDPDQVDRLDYFLAQLHRHGIYANLNMHVGREVSKQFGWPGLGTHHSLMRDKHALHFQPEIQQAYWDFCRQYLSHVNPYRKLRRADDPGIAMVELCNENKFSEAGPSALLSAPEPYKSAIIRRWNAWLQRRYRTTSGLRRAWTVAEAQEDRLVTDSSNWLEAGHGGWKLSDNQGKAPATLATRAEAGEAVARVAPRSLAKQGWHQQLASPPIEIHPGNTHLLRFRGRSDAPRTVGVNVASTASGKWVSLGLSTSIELTPQWNEFKFQFQTPAGNSTKGRLAFDIGGEMAAVEFKELSLVEGGSAVTVPAGQSLESANVGLPGFGWSTKAQRDLRAFMVDTERDFYQHTLRLLKDEVGVRVPITTTQANYHPPGLVNELADYVDMHAYWHHPIFPGKPWDRENWTVRNESLVPYPFQNKWPRVSLLMRSSWRIHGKPFTFSEWNAPEPNFFSADAIPVAAIAASLQDWDAVFLFNYQNSPDEWDTDHIQGYFEINGQPVKCALVSALANLYRRGDLPALKNSAACAPGDNDRLGTLALRYRVGIDPKMTGKGAVEIPSEEYLAEKNHRLFATPNRSVVWDARDPAEARITINTPATRCAWGFVGGQHLSLGAWQVDFGPMERNYAVLVATSRDGKPLEQSRSILLTLVANAENQSMGWNKDRTSVGTNWGHGPTMVNGVAAKITIPPGQVSDHLFALDARGKRIRKIPVGARQTGGHVIQLGPEQKTLFYELSAE